MDAAIRDHEQNMVHPVVQVDEHVLSTHAQSWLEERWAPTTSSFVSFSVLEEQIVELFDGWVRLSVQVKAVADLFNVLVQRNSSEAETCELLFVSVWLKNFANFVDCHLIVVEFTWFIAQVVKPPV
jgi:hypothetical protein